MTPAAGGEATEEAAVRPAPAPVIGSDGRALRISCGLEPVIELKGYSRIGFRMRRRILPAAGEEDLSAAVIAALPRSDLLRIDLATFEHGLDRLEAETDGEQMPALIVPVSYVSLSYPRGREEIAAAFKRARSVVAHGVICEICDIEGVPHAALLAAALTIRPVCLFVVGYVSGGVPLATIRALKGAGLQAISFECPDDLSETEFLGWAKASITAAREVAKSVLVYHTASLRQAGMAALLQATHASVAAA